MLGHRQLVSGFPDDIGPSAAPGFPPLAACDRRLSALHDV